jgi:DNA-binding LacI/PurR family transcriptional regulator
VVGFDDSDDRFRTYPVFTAVCQNAAHLGFEAALWLTQKLAGVGSPTLQKEMSTFFEVNQTTGLPPQQAVRVLQDGTRINVQTQGGFNGP